MRPDNDHNILTGTMGPWSVGGKPFYLWSPHEVEPVAVYQWFDDEDVLLYVGITWNVEKRSGEHRRGADWAGFAKRGEVSWFTNYYEAHLVEKFVITHLRPIFNKSGAGDEMCSYQRRAAYLDRFSLYKFLRTGETLGV